jgi:pyridoxal phosphate enzyme (YggS family)
MSNRLDELTSNLRQVEAEIAPFAPTLIAVTKTYPLSDAQILYDLGVRNFGENRSDEGALKSASVEGNWHYQGAIQSKKLREILSWADCIHSLDELGHAEKIDRVLSEDNRRIDAFLQLSLDGDPERGGVVEDELLRLAESISSLGSITIIDLMCVPPVEMNPGVAFAEIEVIHQRFLEHFPQGRSLSAGMSGDYMIALNHGATHIRVGSKILGPRQYH